MSLNIKKQSVHDLAREAASRTGLSQTSVIEEALTLYLAAIDAPSNRAERGERARAILDGLHRGLDDAARARLLDDDLYDGAGLPR